MNSRLRARRLSYRHLFRDLDIDLRSGQGLIIYGHNGSGKTSLLKTLASLILSPTGTIEWQGRNIHNSLSSYHQDMHFIGHHHGLKSNLSAKENLAYSQSLAKSVAYQPTIHHSVVPLAGEAKEQPQPEFLLLNPTDPCTNKKESLAAAAIANALQQINLLDQSDTLAQQLSAGQKRRLALARLLVAPKQLWILDEPATNLDQDGLQWFCTLLEKHLHTGGIAVIASHQRLPLKNRYPFQEIYLGKVYHG